MIVTPPGCAMPLFAELRCGLKQRHENERHRVRGRPRARRPVADVSAAPRRRQVERRHGAVGCRAGELARGAGLLL